MTSASQESNFETTPSSKRDLDLKDECPDQSSTAKKLCLAPIDLDAEDDENIGKCFVIWLDVNKRFSSIFCF